MGSARRPRHLELLPRVAVQRRPRVRVRYTLCTAAAHDPEHAVKEPERVSNARVPHWRASCHRDGLEALCDTHESPCNTRPSATELCHHCRPLHRVHTRTIHDKTACTTPLHRWRHNPDNGRCDTRPVGPPEQPVLSCKNLRHTALPRAQLQATHAPSNALLAFH